jgi:uncharacterized protein (UPF0276 family)
MKLAMNYSPQAEQLVADGQIALDLFKCPPSWDPVVPNYAPDLLPRARAQRPIYLHFPLHAGRNSLENVDWEQIARALEETNTPYVNVHLQAITEDYPEMPVDTRDPAHLRTIADILIQDVRLVTERFGAERVIVENVSYRGAEGRCLYPCVDPGVIGRVVAETGCGFLLDTAHARLTTAALGIDTVEYISQLPVAHLRELHVVGVQSDGRRLRDSMAMGPEDWAVIEWVGRQITHGLWPTPWVMAFEYGGVGPSLEWRSEAVVMAEQAPRLQALCDF